MLNKNILMVVLTFFVPNSSLCMNSESRIGAHIPIYNKHLNWAKNELEKNPFMVHAACMQRNISLINLLIKAGANLNALNGSIALTPLHYAAQKGYADVVKLLIENGARVNTQDCWTSPLEMAAYKGHDVVAQVLLENGAEVSTVIKSLCIAINKDRINIVKLLVEHGIDLSIKRYKSYGPTPLRCAASKGNRIITELLLSQFNLPQPSTKKGLDLRSLAMINILENIDKYEEESYQYIAKSLSKLNWEKGNCINGIFIRSDLNGKKIILLKRFLAELGLNECFAQHEQAHLKNLKQVILNNNMLKAHAKKEKCEKTIPNITKENNHEDLLCLLNAINNAQTFDDLPESLQQVTRIYHAKKSS